MDKETLEEFEADSVYLSEYGPGTIGISFVDEEGDVLSFDKGDDYITSGTNLRLPVAKLTNQECDLLVDYCKRLVENRRGRDQ